MSSVELVARLLLAGVFALAGVAKLGGLSRFRESVQAFGVPSRLSGAVAGGLPLAELAVAAGLLVSPAARWAAIGAAALLVIFSAGAANALRNGRAPECYCFGQVASAQVSPRTLVRNGVLTLLAAFAAVEAPGSSLTAWTANSAAANLLAALATLVALLLAFMLVSQARAGGDGWATAISGPAAPRVLQPGVAAPQFALTALEGGSVSLADLLARGRPVVLIFTSPTCLPCIQLMPQISRWNGALADELTLAVVVSSVQGFELPADQREMLAGVTTLLEPERELAARYHVAATPSGLSLSSEGLVSSPPMAGQVAIERLVRRVMETGGAVPGEDELIETAVRR